MSQIPSPIEQALLYKVHCLRMEAHWGKNWKTVATTSMLAWPQTREEWSQTNHGAPWDSNVHMAKWHIDLAYKIIGGGEARRLTVI